jgi:hypothetical protein
MKFLFPILLLIILASCTNERDIRDYYFPVRSLTKGMVYEYQPLSGVDEAPIYWYALAVDQDTALYLTVTTYDKRFTPANLVREKITNGGVITKGLRVIATDTSGVSREAQAEVLAGNAFPFYLNRETNPAYVYRVSYVSPDQSKTKITLTYNRQFANDTTFVFQEESYPALVFNLTGETDILDPVNGSLTPKFTGYEIYAEGLGMVESYRNFSGFILHNRLKDRFPMQELQARAKKLLNN